MARGVHNGTWSLLHHGTCGYRGLVATSGSRVIRNTTTNFLDEIRKFKGLVSDYALAKLLRVRQQTITNYRRGRTQMNDKIATRAAHMMGEPPAPLLVQLAAERAKDPEAAKVWKELARSLKRAKREASDT